MTHPKSTITMYHSITNGILALVIIGMSMFIVHQHRTNDQITIKLEVQHRTNDHIMSKYEVLSNKLELLSSRISSDGSKSEHFHQDIEPIQKATTNHDNKELMTDFEANTMKHIHNDAVLLLTSSSQGATKSSDATTFSSLSSNTIIDTKGHSKDRVRQLKAKYVSDSWKNIYKSKRITSRNLLDTIKKKVDEKRKVQDVRSIHAITFDKELDKVEHHHHDDQNDHHMLRRYLKQDKVNKCNGNGQGNNCNTPPEEDNDDTNLDSYCLSKHPQPVTKSLECGARTVNERIRLSGNVICKQDEVGLILENAELDCQGRSIIGNGDGKGTGVSMIRSTLRNCHVEKFDLGVFSEGDSNVEKCFIHNNINGVIGPVGNVVVQHCDIHSNEEFGIGLVGDNNVVQYCTIHNNNYVTGPSLYIDGENILVQHCNVYDNSGFVYIDGKNILVQNCNVYDNGDNSGMSYGRTPAILIDGKNARVQNCNIFNNDVVAALVSNGDDSVGGNNFVQNCNVYKNGGDGVHSSNSIIKDSTIHSNDGSGLLADNNLELIDTKIYDNNNSGFIELGEVDELNIEKLHNVLVCNNSPDVGVPADVFKKVGNATGYLYCDTGDACESYRNYTLPCVNYSCFSA